MSGRVTMVVKFGSPYICRVHEAYPGEGAAKVDLSKIRLLEVHICSFLKIAQAHKGFHKICVCYVCHIDHIQNE